MSTNPVEYGVSRSSQSLDRRMLEELKDFEEDNSKMAREIINIRRELSRLHYKVKSYQKKNQVYQFLFLGLTTLLLTVMMIKLFTL